MDAVTETQAKPFWLDPRVREYFCARLDVIFATNIEDANAAQEKATKILWDLDAEQRGYADVVGRTLAKVR